MHGFFAGSTSPTPVSTISFLYANVAAKCDWDRREDWKTIERTRVKKTKKKTEKVTIFFSTVTTFNWNQQKAYSHIFSFNRKYDGIIYLLFRT